MPMRLLEFQGKRLFLRHGIPVPKGALWPHLPAGGDAFAVKAQTPEGGRGKRGGIRFADSLEDARDVAIALRALRIGANKVDRVYVEERLDIIRELYLAVTLDHDRRCYSVLTSPDGGIDIERLPTERILHLPVNPLSGLSIEDVQRVARFLELTDAAAETATVITAALYDLVIAEDARLAEINPLAVTRGGNLVATDAKVILDANAAFRHPEWKELAIPDEGTEVERAISATGAVAVEVDPGGDVAGVVSGAGLMMATLDMIVKGGGRPQLMIDLGGVVLGGEQSMVRVFQAVSRISPRVAFINAYLQTARCDNFARALVATYSTVPFAGMVVIRLKGRNDETARQILKPLGFGVHTDLEPALAQTLAAANSQG